MRIALVNPTWSFENSIDPGCRFPHLPIEPGACRVPLERVDRAVPRPDDALAVVPEARLACDIVVRGEYGEVVTPQGGLARRDEGVARHSHRFDRAPERPGAGAGASRGCPHSCTFCGQIDVRDTSRRRAPPRILEEVDRLIAQGATYLFSIDEVVLPQKPLPEAFARQAEFGMRTRIDLGTPELPDRLGRVARVSVEAGAGSPTQAGGALPDKTCHASTDDPAERPIHARRPVPFVQANLVGVAGDDPEPAAARRAAGIRANDPVPLSPCRSSPDSRRLRGEPDGAARERAQAHDLGPFDRSSDIREERPAPLRELEAACCPA